VLRYGSALLFSVLGCATRPGGDPSALVASASAPSSTRVEAPTPPPEVPKPAPLATEPAPEPAPSAKTDPSATTNLDPNATANLDPDDDAVVGPPAIIPDCEERLKLAGVKFEPATLPLFEKHGTTCGAPQAVKYVHGPQNIVFVPSPVLTCQLALALARFEGQAARLAEQHFGQRIRSVKHGGTYNCRSMARFKLASEHSYGNAIDLYEFKLSNGKKVNVLSHFGKPGTEPSGAEGRFLRSLARAAFDDATFSVVVTRFFDELHRDHIHVDMAHYRTDGSR